MNRWREVRNKASFRYCLIHSKNRSLQKLRIKCREIMKLWLTSMHKSAQIKKGFILQMSPINPSLSLLPNYVYFLKFCFEATCKMTFSQLPLFSPCFYSLFVNYPRKSRVRLCHIKTSGYAKSTPS